MTTLSNDPTVISNIPAVALNGEGVVVAIPTAVAPVATMTPPSAGTVVFADGSVPNTLPGVDFTPAAGQAGTSVTIKLTVTNADGTTVDIVDTYTIGVPDGKVVSGSFNNAGITTRPA